MDSYPFVLGIIFLMCCGKSESHPYFSQSLSLNALPVRIGASAQKSFSRENDKNTCILWFRRVCHSAATKWSQYIQFIIAQNYRKINISKEIRLKFKIGLA